MCRMHRVIELHAKRIELAILEQVVLVRIGEENELRCVVLSGNVVECSMPIEKRGKEIGVIRLTAALRADAELMPPAEVHERIDVGLVVIDKVASGGVERHLE